MSAPEVYPEGHHHDIPHLKTHDEGETMHTEKIDEMSSGSRSMDVIHHQAQDGPVGTVYGPDGELVFPNMWSKIRHTLREPFAEMLGTMVLIIFGDGVNCQVTLTGSRDVAGSQAGSYLSISFGWGIGVMMGVYVAGGISGAHLNPSVTIGLAAFRGFPWRKVPVYIAGQLVGATAGAAIIYLNYVNAINEFEGGPNVRTVGGAKSTAALFPTYPLAYMTQASCVLNEMLATAVLLVVICAIGDPNNLPPPNGLGPLVLMFLILGIGATLGAQTGYGLNGVRDMGPRLVTWWVGYGTEVWTFRNHYWLWAPWIVCPLGALLGCFLYDLFVYTGTDSPLNKPFRLPPFLSFVRRRSNSLPEAAPGAPVGRHEIEEVQGPFTRWTNRRRVSGTV